MSRWRDAADRIAMMGRFSVGNKDRQLECEKASRRLEGREMRTIGEQEPWDTFLQRIGVIDG